MIERLAVAAALAVLVAACGPAEASVPDYLEDVQALTQAVGAEFDRLDVERRAQGNPDVAQTQAYLDARVEARVTLSEGFSALVPPEPLAEMHDEALAAMERTRMAEEALAARGREMETMADLDALWRSPEAREWRASDNDLMAFCQAAEARFDTPEELAGLGELPWLPSQMGEVVSVAFGCTPAERGYFEPRPLSDPE